jgi:hypothetical protein
VRWLRPRSPILKRQDESLAPGYVAARLVECAFIAIGIVSLLAVVTLQQKAAGADAGSLVTTGKSLGPVRNWTFVLSASANRCTINRTPAA